MKILLIDNYDSFTYNLVHLVKELGYTNVTVCQNDKIELCKMQGYDKIILSPGPGLPSEAGLLISFIQKYAATQSMLGVCLGHQAIAEAFGARLIHLDSVFHGVTSEIEVVASDYLFDLVGTGMEVGRYHSWVVDRENLPKCMEIIAEDGNGQIMALRHKEFDLRGVQFHPESVLTPKGIQIIRNFLENKN